MAGVPLSLLMVVAAATTLAYSVFSWYALRRLDQPGAPAFGALAALMSVVSVSVPGSARLGIRRWYLIPTLLFFVYAPLWTWFVLTYIGEEHKLSRGKVLLLVLLPAVGAVNAAVEMVAGPGGNSLLSTTRLVTVMYAFALVFGGALLLLRAGYTYSSTDTRRALSLALASLLPVLVPVTLIQGYFAGTPVAEGYLLGYGLAAIAFGYTVFERDLFESVPVAEAIGRDIVVTEMDDGVLVVDDDGWVVDGNAAARELLGIEQRQVRNEPVESLFEADVKVPDDGESTEITTGDGTRILDLSATELAGSADAPVGRILTLRDVTGRVRRRQQLEKLNRQNERLNRLVSVVSHDLRNPLAVADGYLNMARETGEDQHFEKVLDAHDRIETMVDELLTMAKSGISVEETEQVVLHDLVADVWATVRTEDATLEIALSETVTVEADWSLLRHILENLFRNAIDHNDPPVTITVGTLTAPADGFYVADDGRGIPADKREVVFEHGHTTDEDGTGFGLSIVAQFVGAHDWEIVVTDSEDGGARFEIVDVDPGRDSS
jgi:signal transduction histidine kinase